METVDSVLIIWFNYWNFLPCRLPASSSSVVPLVAGPPTKHPNIIHYYRYFRPLLVFSQWNPFIHGKFHLGRRTILRRWCIQQQQSDPFDDGTRAIDGVATISSFAFVVVACFCVFVTLHRWREKSLQNAERPTCMQLYIPIVPNCNTEGRRQKIVSSALPHHEPHRTWQCSQKLFAFCIITCIDPHDFLRSEIESPGVLFVSP